MINRETALSLLQSFSPDAHLLQHALASEAILRQLAMHFQEDVDLWGYTGLLHDLDFPLTKATPDQHGLLGAERLADILPSVACMAIRAHNPATGIAPTTRLDWALRCGETVTGLVITAALVRPTGMDGMEAKSLKKKMKDKAFAASVCRDTIRECTHLGLELDEFLGVAIAALTPISKELGLVKN